MSAIDEGAVGLKREEKAWLVSLIVVAGFSLSVVFHYWLGFYRGDPYPRNTFLFLPSDHSMDFYNLFNPIKAGNPFSYRWWIYFPFAYLPFSLLTPFSARSVYTVFMAIFVGAVVLFLYRRLDFLPPYERATATFILSFLTYPFLFCLDRGNFECLVFVFLCLFFTAFRRDKQKLSVFFLACAIAMKAYPGVFVILFVARRRYKDAFAAVALAGLLTVLSAAVSPAGVAGSFRGLMYNLGLYKEVYIIGDGGLAFGSSYFGVMKVISSSLHPLSPERLNQLLLPYALLCFAAFALLALYVVLYEKTLWKKVALLSFSMILLPQVSGDYKLIHLLFPLALFISSAEEDRRAALYSVLFGLLLIPKALFWIKGDISVSVILNPLLMTAMIFLILVDGLRRPSAGLSRETPSAAG